MLINLLHMTSPLLLTQKMDSHGEFFKGTEEQAAI
jgi:hypothetical protein